MHNSKNEFQGKTKRVLCVCSAGLLRSPTAARILSAEPFNFNTRAVGCMSEYALIKLDKVLINWADLIICFEKDHLELIMEMADEMAFGTLGEIKLIECPDNFNYMNPQLVAYLTNKFKELFNDGKST